MPRRVSATTSIRWPTIATRPTTPRLSAAGLCALNAGLQFIWGAVLAVSLQERSIALGGPDGVRRYAFIAATGAGVATLVQLLAGRLSDRARLRGRDRGAFYACGVAFALPALGWFYLAPTLAQLTVAFWALECAMNVVTGPYQAIISDYVSPARRGRASAWMSAYQSIGNAAGLVVAGFIHDVAIVAVVLGAGLLASYVVTARAVPAAMPAAAAEVAVAARKPAARRALVALLVSRGLVNVGFFTLLGFLLFFVRDSLHVRGAALETQTALLFLCFTLCAALGAGIAARPADRYDKRVVVSVAAGSIAVALAALASATVLTVAYAAAAVAGAAWGAFVTADWALATIVLPRSAMATAMGVWNVATTLPQVLAPLVAAPLVVRLDDVGSGLGPRAAIVLALIEFAAGGILIWRVPRSGAAPSIGRART